MPNQRPDPSRRRAAPQSQQPKLPQTPQQARRAAARRAARKAAARGPREYFTATCAACGGEAKVPFEPKSDRPVYCSECFARMKGQA